MSLPRWTAVDELNLRGRIRRANGPRPKPTDAGRDRRSVTLPLGCSDCTFDGHRHSAVRIGPFTICRCLSCPVLVVPA